MGKEIMIIKNLNEYIDWVARFKGGEYLFRGVKKSFHPIEASAYRRIGENKQTSELSPEINQDDTKKSPEALLENNRELIEKARLLGHGQRGEAKLSDLDLLAELQHYGAATCLIDFTYNSLVALWFACPKKPESKKENEKPKNNNGKVVVLRSDGPESLKRVDYEMSQKDIDFFFKPDKTGRFPLYQWQPKHQNNRIIAQQSVFVFGHGPIKIDPKCEIDMNCKEEILAELETLSGINGARLFFDFYGYAWLNAENKQEIERTTKAYRIRGIEMFQKEDTERAIKYFTDAIEIAEKEKSDLENANALTKEKEKELDLSMSENYRDRGRAHYYRDDFDKALEDHNEAIALDPKNAHAYNARGVTLETKGNLALRDNNVDNDDAAKKLFNKAIKDYKDALEEDKQLVKAWSNLGNVYASLGAFELENKNHEKANKLFNKAIKNYNKAIKGDNELAIAYCNLGEVWLHKQKWNEAQKALEKAQEMGVDIADSFHRDYESVEKFEEKYGIDLRKDLAKMLRKKE